MTLKEKKGTEISINHVQCSSSDQIALNRFNHTGAQSGLRIMFANWPVILTGQTSLAQSWLISDLSKCWKLANRWLAFTKPQNETILAVFSEFITASSWNILWFKLCLQLTKLMWMNIFFQFFIWKPYPWPVKMTGNWNGHLNRALSVDQPLFWALTMQISRPQGY